MSDYFDQFGSALEDAVERRAHLRWYARLRLPARGHGFAIVLAALLVAAPAVAAVGAASGWFSAGKPDVFYPPSSTAGLGRSTAGTHMLPVRVPDPDGGPPWGMRVVKTNRGNTCVQVGRVEYGGIGSLGIDDSWGNDHRFHPISPNAGASDFCGATDAAGHGFVNAALQSWTASAFMPTDYGSGAAVSFCQNARPGGSTLQDQRSHMPANRPARKALELRRRQQQAAQARTHLCPAGSLRMIFVGLLGPQAKSITYTTPSGSSATEDTVGDDGAYLIVLPQTPSNCARYQRSALSAESTCEGNYGFTQSPALKLPGAVTSVTYTNGTTCSDQPPPSLLAAWNRYRARAQAAGQVPIRQARARLLGFLAAHHLTRVSLFRTLNPQCPLVGWVAPNEPRLTAADVASRVTVTLVEAHHWCDNSRPGNDGTTIACDHRVPIGFHRTNETPPGGHRPPLVLVTASFTAHEPVTTTNSWYEWDIENPGNGGGQGSRTQTNIRRGQRVTFTAFVPSNQLGTYRGVVSFMANAGQQGAQGGDNPDRDGSIVVDHFSFKLPVGH